MTDRNTPLKDLIETGTIGDLIDALAGVGAPEVLPETLGVKYDFSAAARGYLKDRHITDLGPRAQRVMDTLPTRLLYLSADHELGNSSEEVTLLYANADDLQDEPSWFSQAILRGYPFAALNDLNGTTIPGVMAVIPINRAVARDGGRVTSKRARNMADDWARTKIHAANLADEWEKVNE